MSNSKDASDLSYEELKNLLESKKSERISVLEKEISELEQSLAGKKNEFAELTGVSAAPKEKRGRKPKGFASIGKKEAKNSSRGRSSGLKDKIVAFLSSKGKEGAHVDDIAKHVGKPKANVNAFLATTGKKAGVKGKGKRSGIYYLQG
jgi:hypothetical protein